MLHKTHKNSKKRGFTLAETVVALSLITIVFSMTVTSVLAISSTYKKIENLRFFVNEINNYLECYKLGGAERFSESVNLYLLTGDIKLTPPSNSDTYECVICYDADFNKTGIFTARGGYSFGEEYRQYGKFYVFITIDKCFYAHAAENDNTEIYSVPKKYYGRYDT